MEYKIFIPWYVLPRDHLFSETFSGEGMAKKIVISVEINHLYCIHRHMEIKLGHLMTIYKKIIISWK